MINFKNCFTSFTELIVDSKFANKNFELYENHFLIKEGLINNSISTKEINLNYLYYLKIDNLLIEISKHNLYDTQKFNSLFNYKGNLGCIFSDTSISFKVFAPTKFHINLNIYKTGHNDDLVQSIQMKKNKGIFEVEVGKSFENFYYTYSVFDNIDINKKHEVVDPYAKTTGVNGLRAMITDLSSTKKINSNYPKRKFNEAIVYELHTRDLTIDESWNGNDEHRGKFLGLIEDDTTYSNGKKVVRTGFCHIKELGVTDVQLLPIFDFFMVDETRLNDPSYKDIRNGIFNWGYMGLNFNTLEGSYSTNPYDGLVRVNEFKEVVETYNNNNIGIIMDVVYNHTAFSEESNFNILVPGYYHRLNNNTFSNASACGNETASERYMMRKFMVESIVFLAKEYHLSGFRFDLMQVHDVDTMNLISKELKKIDSSILIYGEPWSGGTSTLPLELQAGKLNLFKMKNIGAFNDELRDGIKGSVFDFKNPGFVQGYADEKMVEQIKYGIVGGVTHPQINFNLLNDGAWHNSSSKCVNYASAHDNHTIWDKLTLSSNVSIEQRKEMQKQINATVLLSQGLSFIHAGSEFCRSKPKRDGSLEDNSYDSCDYTNKIRWNDKIENYDVFKFNKELIKFRKENNVFHLDDKRNLNINFINYSKEYISFIIENKYLIIINSNFETTITLSNVYQIIIENNVYLYDKKMAYLGDYHLTKNSINILKL